MTTIDLKTQYIADEPDHSVKLISLGRSTEWERRPSESDPLVYVVGRGWTWRGTMMYYTWDEYVQKHHAHFPLTEQERKASVSRVQELDLTDSSGDKLKVRTCSWSDRVEIGVIDDSFTPSTMVYLRDENLLKLRDLLNEVVTEA